MRIWLITSELPHEFAGGIARYVDNCARALGAAGHDVTIFARTGEPVDRIVADGVRLVGVVPGYEQLNRAAASQRPDDHPGYPFNIMSYWPAFSFQVAQTVLERLEQEPEPEVIECQEYGGLPYYLLQRKLVDRTKLERVPIIVHLHSPVFEMLRVNQGPRYRFPDYWVGQMEKFSIVAADGLLCPSAYLTDSIRAQFSQPLDIATIPLPFVANYEAAPGAGVPGELVYVGRLEWRKGVFQFVRVCEQFWSEGRDFRLTLIGGDTDFAPRGTTVGAMIRSRFRRWIERGRLRLTGPVQHAEVMQRLRDAWAAVVPSLWENFPNTCIEAMATGQLPLVSTAGGQAEMVGADGECGFVFDWDAPGDAGSKLERVLALDRHERAEIARRAQKRIASLCHPDVVIPNRVAHFERVIRGRRRRATFPTIVPRSPQAPPLASKSLPPHRAGAPAEPEAPGLLSVVVPFYNLGEFVEETLESIRGGGYQPLEVILVNDGSTNPASVRKLEEIEARRLPDVRIVHTTNQGLASARNNGVRAARGEYIALVDADDKVDPTFFARAIDVLRRYPNVGFVTSWVRYFDGSHGIWPTWNAELPYILGHNMSCVLSVVRRRAFRAIGGANPAFAYNYEDYGGWVGLTVAGWAGVSIPEPLVLYRIRPGSMLRNMTDAQFMYLHDVMTQCYPEAYRAFGDEIFNLQNANGPGRLWNHPAIETGYSALQTEVTRAAPRERTAADTPAAPAIPAPAASNGRSAEEELRWIEDSRAWRLVQRVKRTFPYRALARLRFGPGWDHIDSAAPPAERLAQIKASRAWRLIQAVKSTSLHKWYAVRKYGPDCER